MNRRDGETANRSRMAARSPFLLFLVSRFRRTSSVASGILDQPLLRLIDHFDELPENAFVGIVDFTEFGLNDITVTPREFDVHLRFSGFGFRITKFGNESRF